MLIASFRWKYILEKYNKYTIAFNKAFQMVTGSYSANLIIPAKMGEVVRVFWIDKKKSAYRPILIILFEKIWDLISVYLIFYFSLLFLIHLSPKFQYLFYISSIANIIGILAFIVIFHFWRKGYFKSDRRIPKLTQSLIEFIVRNKGQLVQTAIWSIALWLVQILQFYFMFRVFGADLSIPLVLSGSALAILAGAVVISIGGVGPRDAALIWFFAGFLQKEILVSVGIISVFRIIVPALFGLPFFIKLSVQSKTWKTSSGDS